MRYECHRLDIGTGSRFAHKDLVDNIVSFIDNNGVGHEMRDSNSNDDQDRWKELIDQCKHRGIRVKRRHKFQNIPMVEEIVARYDRKEEECLKLSKDINLPDNNIDRHRPALVIICSRGSSSKTESLAEKYRNEHGRLRRALERGQILVGLENATYVHVYRWKTSLIQPLPITSGRLHKKPVNTLC